MKTITTRRTLEQIKHCVEEALSVVEHGEDEELAADDLNQAVDLTLHILKRWNKRRPQVLPAPR